MNTNEDVKMTSQEAVQEAAPATVTQVEMERAEPA